MESDPDNREVGSSGPPRPTLPVDVVSVVLLFPKIEGPRYDTDAQSTA